MMSRWVSALVVLVSMFGGAAQGQAAETVAVFPFELLDQSQPGEFILKVRPEETKRLVLMTEDLKARLLASKRYDIVDLGPLAADLKAASPLHQCNGCEADLVKKTSAQLAILGLVQKISDTQLSVSIQVLDAATGVLKNSYTAGLQGNTDEAWLRGVSYIARNRLLTEGPKQ